ncbi:MAG: UDP-N-acetylmuramoyl-L-alanyl-D-glutamate--2,6-diaminopimelate ligase [bacterium]
MVRELDPIALAGDPEVEITSIEYDSRQVREGALFVAVRGFKQDGYDYAAKAIASGAVAIMGENQSGPGGACHVQVADVRIALSHVAAKLYGFPGRNLKVCGVTGTNGKTTTCHLIRQILQARQKKVGLVSSVIYDTGNETFAAERTTPESLDMQRLLYLMKKNHCVNAVVEVSSHSLVLHRVDNIDFRVAVYTNLTRDHLDFHKNMDDYLAAKKLLLGKLSGPLSYAVINLDVPEFSALFADYSGSYIAYSLENQKADVYCRQWETKPHRTNFDLVTPMGTRTVSLPLAGKFNLQNALAAASAGLASGVDLDNVIVGLEQARPVPGRFEAIDCGQPFGVYVDFAHTPDALTRLCESARELTEGRLLILFGCGGDRDRGKRPLMGRAAADGADYCVVTSDNPRSEKPEDIIKQILPGLKGQEHQVILDRAEAVAAIMRLARPGDAVLLAGKGAETYQEIQGQRYAYNDIAEATRALAELGFNATAVEET